MGTWGPGGFETDTALDFAAEITSPEVLQDTFDEVLTSEDDCIDADLSAQAITAAECVAAMMGHPADDMPDELVERVAGFGRLTIHLRDAARDCVSSVLRRSELVELWAEDDPAEFNLAMTSLIDRLNPDFKPKRGKKKWSKASPRFICGFCDGDIEEHEALSIDYFPMRDAENPIKHGFWCHLKCLNARLHPKHIVQDWQFDPDEIEREAKKLLGHE